MNEKLVLDWIIFFLGWYYAGQLLGKLLVYLVFSFS
jgi:hypothetical protein